MELLGRGPVRKTHIYVHSTIGKDQTIILFPSIQEQGVGSTCFSSSKDLKSPQNGFENHILVSQGKTLAINANSWNTIIFFPSDFLKRRYERER